MANEESTEKREQEADAASTPPEETGAEETVRDLEELQKKAEEYLDLARRAKAELINYQDRARREQERFVKYAIEGFAADLLPAMDSMRRSLASLEGSSDPQAVLEGVKLIEKEFLRVLAKHGITPLSVEGGTFDPEYHEAVSTEERGDAAENTILEEVRRGWKLHDRVLRAASVRIAKRKEG